MAKDLMAITTEIGGIVSGFQTKVQQIGHLVAEATTTRVKSGRTNTLKADIRNAIKDLPAEYQVEALITAVIAIAGNKSTEMDEDLFADSKKRFGSNW